jgi:hypothetical protein
MKGLRAPDPHKGQRTAGDKARRSLILLFPAQVLAASADLQFVSDHQVVVPLPAASPGFGQIDRDFCFDGTRLPCEEKR